ncbi:hypothetical protein WA026_010389 [Henosepilachna vigintioctopunctata]|uniref:Polyadenylate-binding protein-interacting protein 2 n=1 Tax=Henosepilachna vigintioctopunctata TaxID=420089 RepID=A0AAW1VBB8_9CUCU
MKMPSIQSAENGLYDYEDNSYYGENIDNLNNSIEDYGSTGEDVFSEYLWMENEEEFDKEVMQRLEEEALMEQCIEAMLADETSDSNMIQGRNITESTNEVSNLITNLKIDSAEVAKGSNLNPLAEEFIPSANTTSKSVDTSS